MDIYKKYGSTVCRTILILILFAYIQTTYGEIIPPPWVTNQCYNVSESACYMVVMGNWNRIELVQVHDIIPTVTIMIPSKLEDKTHHHDDSIKIQIFNMLDNGINAGTLTIENKWDVTNDPNRQGGTQDSVIPADGLLFNNIPSNTPQNNQQFKIINEPGYKVFKNAKPGTYRVNIRIKHKYQSLNGFINCCEGQYDFPAELVLLSHDSFGDICSNCHADITANTTHGGGSGDACNSCHTDTAIDTTTDTIRSGISMTTIVRGIFICVLIIIGIFTIRRRR